MDLYEELGLAHSASAEEIRTVYKTLVRVLHPDGQSNESARRIADLQLKRLNGIAEVLLNPARRRRYDLSLELRSAIPPRPAFVMPPAPLPRFTAPWTSSVILVVAGVVLGSVGEFVIQRFTGDTAPPSSNVALHPVEDPAAGASASDQPAPQPTAPAAVRAGQEERHAPAPTQVMAHIVLRPQPIPVASVRVAPVTTAPPATQPPPPPLPVAESAAMPDAPSPKIGAQMDDQVSPLSGRWLYTPPAQGNSVSHRLYSPEFIELSSKVEGGYISGSFRSRYDVTNQRFSPTMNFHFRGRLTNAASTTDWVSSDGGRGTMSLRLLPSGELKVDWFLTRAGSAHTLAYGRAVLVKEAGESTPQ